MPMKPTLKIDLLCRLWAQLPFYIASSKAAHRISRIEERQLGVDLPVDSPRLFAGLIPPNEEKAATLR